MAQVSATEGAAPAAALAAEATAEGIKAQLANSIEESAARPGRTEQPTPVDSPSNETNSPASALEDDASVDKVPRGGSLSVIIPSLPEESDPVEHMNGAVIYKGRKCTLVLDSHGAKVKDFATQQLLLGARLADIYKAIRNPKDAKSFFLVVYITDYRKRETKRYQSQFHTESVERTQTWIDDINNWLYPPTTPKRRITFLINPFSGKRRAPKVFNMIRPLFEGVGIVVIAKETERAGDAYNFALQLRPQNTDSVVVVSGDGLMHEVVNGLMARDDWATVVRSVPLGIVPAGSGNGLAASVRAVDPLAAAMMVIKGFTRPLDVLSMVQFPFTEKPRFGFLAFAWCIISDVDIESEKYRFLGPSRTTIGAIKRLLFLRSYRGRLSYLPADDAATTAASPNTPPSPEADCRPNCHVCKSHLRALSERVAAAEPSPRLASAFDAIGRGSAANAPGWTTIEDEFVYFLASNVSHIALDFKGAPHAHALDGTMDLVFVRRKDAGTMKLLGMMSKTETGEYMQSELVEYHKVRAFELEPLAVYQGGKLVHQSLPLSGAEGAAEQKEHGVEATTATTATTAAAATATTTTETKPTTTAASATASQPQEQKSPGIMTLDGERVRYTTTRVEVHQALLKMMFRT